MDLKTLLGGAYHEGMTLDEINTAISGMKIADLSTGNYVDKNKYEADIKAKDTALQKKAEELASKMSADEKAAAAQAEKDALIESLKAEISASKITNSKTAAESIMSQSKNTLGIKDDDKAYTNFIDSIAGENIETTKTLATYINKLVNDAYEKGTKDASKDNLGKFASNIKVGGSADAKDPVGKLGTDLAKAFKVDENNSNLYFKN